MDNSGQVFTTINEMVEQTKLPYRTIYNYINSKNLPAIKKVNSYYIYSKDADKYVFNIICEARGLPENNTDVLFKERLEYILRYLGGANFDELVKEIKEGGHNNDKPKN